MFGMPLLIQIKDLALVKRIQPDEMIKGHSYILGYNHDINKLIINDVHIYMTGKFVKVTDNEPVFNHLSAFSWDKEINHGYCPEFWGFFTYNHYKQHMENARTRTNLIRNELISTVVSRNLVQLE